MTAREIFELRQQGQREEAYEAARSLYAMDKSPYVSLAMFWTAVDMLRLQVEKGHLGEARKIFLALERLLPAVPDEDGRVGDAFVKCRDLLEKEYASQCVQKKSSSHLQMGVWGEDLAVGYLREKGYVILEFPGSMQNIQ